MLVLELNNNEIINLFANVIASIKLPNFGIYLISSYFFTFSAL